MFLKKSAPHLLVGLGNPGREYRNNRHNVGFMVIDHLAERHNLSLSRKSMQALIGKGEIEGKKVILAKPQTYVNNSGRAVGSLMRYYQIPLPQLMVIQDDLDLPFGKLRLRPSGGSGGQKGLRSISQHLASDAFPRLRIGIGRPPGRMDPADYVLQDFSDAERRILDDLLDSIEKIVHCYLSENIQAAMNSQAGDG